ncbi:serine hydrolase domain-containing protein [Bradyrhizobium sp. STM 3557]|uniref:serine hydrolase domain-containing protein n=1 Tax=Bradyrhizobium sp. STM 3557 TaxID=578920 RepID=UPI00388FCCC6
MTHRRLFLIATSATVLGLLGYGIARARDVPQVATGFVASLLCAETFVSGLDPGAVLAETTDAMPGTRLLTSAMTTHVDRVTREVTAGLLGVGRSRAVYRDSIGCTLDHGDGIAKVTVPSDERAPPLLPEIAPSSPVAPVTPELSAALDRAFAEPDAPPFRRTHAVVVVKNGRVIAERYANGYGVDAPLLGFSATKSVISALIGILVREHKLAPQAPAPVAAWQHQNDPRHAVTVDQLLRHTAGLALGSSLEASLLSALQPVNRMFGENDMAAFAEGFPLATAPGTAWNYHDGNYLILSQLIRNASGGGPDDALRFARHELFAPLGMDHVTLQVDASGTVEGSSQMLASARDWARFGLLYLHDGVIGGKRILPEGWVDYSAAPTPNAFVGYGAGFWTNRDDSFGARHRIDHGWPRDAFFAKGTMGQYVIIIPSEHLVIARFGRTVNWPLGADGVSDLVSDVVKATKGMKVAKGD